MKGGKKQEEQREEGGDYRPPGAEGAWDPRTIKSKPESGKREEGITEGAEEGSERPPSEVGMERMGRHR